MDAFWMDAGLGLHLPPRAQVVMETGGHPSPGVRAPVGVDARGVSPDA